MSANDTKKNEPVTLIDEAKSVLTTAAWKVLKPVAKAYQDATEGLLVAQLNLGREAGTIIAKMVERGGDRKAALAFFTSELSEKMKWDYSASHVSTWITAAEGFDSLTAKQQGSFKSLDVFRKLTGIPVEAEGEETRQQFVDRIISAGMTSENAVRDAVSAERKRRSGTPDNELTRIRQQSDKVAKLAGKDAGKLSKVLVNAASAKLFLAGAKWAAGQIDKQKGFNVKAYQDGFAEALHPLVIQPDPTPVTETPKPVRQRRQKATA